MSEQVRMAKSDWLALLEAIRAKGDIFGKMTASQAAEAVEQMGLFSASMFGEDSRALDIEMPFCPDVIMVYAIAPIGDVKGNTYRGLMADLRSCGQNMAQLSYCSPSGALGSSRLTTSAGLTSFNYQDGVFHFELPPESLPDMVWRSHIRYAVTAARFPNENIPELVIEQFSLLPDDESGTVTYNAERIGEFFETEDWEAMLTIKPNWTVVLA